MLAYDEVAALGEPAIFSAFGDHLVFVQGTVYELPAGVPAGQFTQPHLIQGARPITNLVGAEFGWRHLEGCRCRLCRGDERQAA
jgi:hypothetical protein